MFCPAEWPLTWIWRERSSIGSATHVVSMLPILHDLQAQFGYIDERGIPLIADALNVSRAETLGVISFYHDFRRSPIDGRVLKLCRAESCQAMGCEELVSHLAGRHGIKVDDEDDELCASRRNGLLPGQLRAVAVRAARRRADRPSRPQIASTRSSPTRKGRRNERACLHPRRFFGACPSAPTSSPAAIRERSAPPRPRHRARAHRIARPLLARAAGRGRDRRGPRRLWPGRAAATLAHCSRRIS